MSRDALNLVFGVLMSIGITTAMDATGYSPFSALPLALLLGLFWWLQGFSRQEIGFVWGPRKPYLYAMVYPVLVMIVLVLAAGLSGAIDLSSTDWNKSMLNLFVGGLSTVLVVLITEEGFFRGWLWAGLQRIGYSERATLIVTSLVFTTWHISAVILDTGFDLPAWQIPIYLVNATLLGLSWGLLRQWSGSIVVPSVCHGIWNGLAYALFGFGEHTGALGIQQTWIFGPETGLLGIGVNVAVVYVIWRAVGARSR